MAATLRRDPAIPVRMLRSGSVWQSRPSTPRFQGVGQGSTT
jgi:hypothetical protein